MHTEDSADGGVWLDESNVRSTEVGANLQAVATRPSSYIAHAMHTAIGVSIVKRTVVWHAMLEELLDAIVGSSA